MFLLLDSRSQRARPSVSPLAQNSWDDVEEGKMRGWRRSRPSQLLVVTVQRTHLPGCLQAWPVFELFLSLTVWTPLDTHAHTHKQICLLCKCRQVCRLSQQDFTSVLSCTHAHTYTQIYTHLAFTREDRHILWATSGTGASCCWKL